MGCFGYRSDRFFLFSFSSHRRQMLDRLLQEHPPLAAVCDTNGFVLDANERSIAYGITKGTLLQTSLQDIASKRTWIQLLAESKMPLSVVPMLSVILHQKPSAPYVAECRVVDDPEHGRVILVVGVQELMLTPNQIATKAAAGMKKFLHDLSVSSENGDLMVLALDIRQKYIYCTDNVESVLGFKPVNQSLIISNFNV